MAKRKRPCEQCGRRTTRRIDQVPVCTTCVPSTPITLTLAQWEEISAALSSKQAAVERGFYPWTKRKTQRWLSDLKKIQDTIGPHGHHAITRGVGPVRKEKPQ